MAQRNWTRALVTGASAGIGASITRELAARGSDVVIVARAKDRLEALAGELTGRHAVDVEVLAADLADPMQLAAVERRVASTSDPIDLLVNNAGFGFNGHFGDTPVDDEDGEIRVNVVALMRLCHAFVTRPRDETADRPGVVGGILNVSSTASFQPGPGTANYSATKAYVTSFSQALFEEQRSRGITVTALCPGLTRTEFQDRGGYEVDKLPAMFWQGADEVARIGLDAVSAGRPVVVAGIHNKALQVASRLAPMGLARWSAGQVLERFR